MAWAGWATVGAALVVIGVILGSALSSSSSPGPSTTAGGLPSPPPAPPTVCGSSGQAADAPGACMVKQSRGTADARWIVRASGFAPRKPVTVTLIWNSPPIGPPQTSSNTVKVDPASGTFLLDIHRLFPGTLKLGQFTVEVSGTGNAEASTTFIVIPAGG
jgi:hypothetical protein